MRFTIAYSPEALDHLRLLAKSKLSFVLDEVDQQLQHQPLLETRKRKVLRPNPLAPYELRLGDIRVFYDVQQNPTPTVTIKAIGVKQNNDLYVGGERMDL